MLIFLHCTVIYFMEGRCNLFYGKIIGFFIEDILMGYIGRTGFPKLSADW
jgi:hypothetical protein